ncbi:MAG: response regulator [Bacteroidia bacterium]|nr:response regulator [Bacteroidia bacterium]
MENQNNKNHKILIADDEPGNVEAIFQALQNIGYKMIVANNGQICFELAKSDHPSLIIMDWDMPVMDGLEAIRKLKEVEETKNIPVIMATGKMTSTENLEMAMRAGAVDFVRKPVNPVEIVARVRSVILLFEENKKNLILERKLLNQKIVKANEELELNKKHLQKTHLNYNKHLKTIPNFS